MPLKKNDSLPRAGYLNLMLHAHLPYVLHHGTWPHGLEWLLEAAAETYLPLLTTLARLREDSVPFAVSVSLSPVLVEQLAHPDFKAELPRYLQRKVDAAREDAAFFEQAGEGHLLALARHWEVCFVEAMRALEGWGGDVVAGFREAQDAGSLLLMTSAATHGYVPLLGTDESVRAQFATAATAHARHFEKKASGVWLPECGYRPASEWSFPITPKSGDALTGAREGTESALESAGLEFTVVDTQLVLHAGASSVYRPYTVAGSDVAVFPRDPRTAAQVWSAEYGYPGDFEYLDFHKKRWPGGHRYWRVTGAGLGMEAKELYSPDAAAERVRMHAEHFVRMVVETLAAEPAIAGKPAVLTAPFDLELFGHWWHEGVRFLAEVAHVLHANASDVQAITGDVYLQRFGAGEAIRMVEGSWGAEGDNSVWLNGETGWVYRQIYAAELAVREASASAAWVDGGTGERIARQMCRELMLMESSDWTTLITTGAARDYAERRFREHATSFETVLGWWASFLAGEAFDEAALRAMETRDAVFPDLATKDWRR